MFFAFHFGITDFSGQFLSNGAIYLDDDNDRRGDPRIPRDGEKHSSRPNQMMSFEIWEMIGDGERMIWVLRVLWALWHWPFLTWATWGRDKLILWYGTFAQPESHFTYSSPRFAPRAVPSTFLLNCFWAFLAGLGRGEDASGTVPLQNPKVTSRKACLRNAHFILRASDRDGENGALAKRWFCVSDTCNCRRFPGSEEQRAEYCFESTASEERPHWVLWQTRWALGKARWAFLGGM